MSYCRKEGKDKIIFATEEYLNEPSNVVLLPDDPNEIDTSNVGAILPNGDINWDCPCLGNLPNGPCGPTFREAFSCWVENKDSEEDFAANCFENFTKWEKCLGENKHIYNQGNEDYTESTNSRPLETSIEDAERSSIKAKEVSNIENETPELMKDPNRAIAAASTST